ncbi:uncharacterized protein BJX67DRAFT_347097 [Aspergillus lucknowensis]|uniref:Uncharacterized protein n=1 Tax=Aspergillus lucknowensis TaxID=176173 RepID=A0ABR4LZF8_9EURO
MKQAHRNAESIVACRSDGRSTRHSAVYRCLDDCANKQLIPGISPTSPSDLLASLIPRLIREKFSTGPRETITSILSTSLALSSPNTQPRR